MTWVVTGGAGYIGAHLVRALRAADVDVLVVDDLSGGVAARVPDGVPVEQGSVLDRDFLARVFDARPVQGVVHLAARKRVDESVDRPSYYYHENVEGLRRLLDQAVAAGVRQFLFSSSAAVYGAAASPIDETTPCEPVSPYGQTKLAGEWLTHAVGAATGMRTLALRYFNVAGTAAPELADLHGMNLVPTMLRAIRRGAAPVIFGADYPTPDGTCVRDYIHVVDLARAHLLGLEHLAAGSPSDVFNLGNGVGFTNRQVVETCADVTGADVRVVFGPRRDGDPAMLVASAEKARAALGWMPERTSLHAIVGDAWRWHLAHPDGYS